MPNITREERLRREAERSRQLDEARAGDNPQAFGVLNIQSQHDLDRRNEIDERRENWRPATPVDMTNPDEVTSAPDERRFAGDMAKALNQMVGRAAQTENTDPQPHVTLANNPPVVADVYGRPQREGTEVRLLKGYQPLDTKQPKHKAGEVIRVDDREARRLVNLDVAKFTDA